MMKSESLSMTLFNVARNDTNRQVKTLEKDSESRFEDVSHLQFRVSLLIYFVLIVGSNEQP